jgi:Ca2+:H+ antiporter
VTGVLQSTLGNLPEFFVVIFALADGEVVVAQFSIIGSIFANALLVLGLVIVVGARRADDGVMRFSARLPNDTATLLLLAGFIIVLVGVSSSAHDRASDDIVAISAIASVLVLAVYLVWVVGYLRAGHPAHAEAPTGDGLPLRTAIILLALAGAGAAFVSDWFVAALRPTIDQLGISEQFAGLVIVAIAGNAVENAAGVVLAAKGQSDLAISVVKNSVAQIAAFLAPALVLVSLLFVHRLTFDVAPVYVAALFLTTLSVWQITGDGEAAAFEGAALIATYLILAVFTLYE